MTLLNLQTVGIACRPHSSPEFHQPRFHRNLGSAAVASVAEPSPDNRTYTWPLKLRTTVVVVKAVAVAFHPL